MTDRRVLSVLGRWHQWRRAYSTERNYARAGFAGYTEHGDEDELEALTMRAVEAEMEHLGADFRMALQHVARAECMGVEVIFNPRLGGHALRTRLVEQALRAIEKRLLQAGVL